MDVSRYDFGAERGNGDGVAKLFSAEQHEGRVEHVTAIDRNGSAGMGFRGSGFSMHPPASSDLEFQAKNASRDRAPSNTYSRREEGLEEVPLKPNHERANPRNGAREKCVFSWFRLFFFMHRHQGPLQGPGQARGKQDSTALGHKQASARANERQCLGPHAQGKYCTTDKFINQSAFTIFHYEPSITTTHLYPEAPIYRVLRPGGMQRREKRYCTVDLI